jgi:hypothetical protein
MECFGGIAWREFSWEAFATLVAGILAVIAAGVIGWRQSQISKRQAEILDGQLQLERQRHKAELFEKRFAVYEATRKILQNLMKHANEPEDEFKRAYLVAIDQSKFLFRHDVYESLDRLWRDICMFSANKAQMTHNFETIGTYGQAEIDRNQAYLLAFMNQLDNLSDLFGDELRLGAL